MLRELASLCKVSYLMKNSAGSLCTCCGLLLLIWCSGHDVTGAADGLVTILLGLASVHSSSRPMFGRLIIKMWTLALTFTPRQDVGGLWRAGTDNAEKNEQPFPRLLRAFNNLIPANQTETSWAPAVQRQRVRLGWSPAGQPQALFYGKIRGLQNLLTQIFPAGIK